MAQEQVLRDILDGGRDLVSGRLSEQQAALLPDRAQRHLAALEPGAPRFQKRLNRVLFALGPTALALYRALRDDLAVPQDAALQLVSDLLERRTRTGFGQSRLKQTVIEASLKLVPLRRLHLARMASLREPDGFRMQPVDGDALVAFDVQECALVKYFAVHGAPELTALFCRLDDVMMEYVDGLDLVRNGTIGRGAERCDFRYHRRR